MAAGCGRRCSAPAWFRRRDHLGDPRVGLADAARDLVQERTGARPRGPVRLLTHLRYFGYCINPVSFYYCLDAAGEHVETVVAHVTNTPWGEQHSYVMPVRAREDHGSTSVLRQTLPKELHVSPFMGLDHTYDWRLTEPARTLSVHIESARHGEVMFDATLSLTRREISRRSLATALMRHPCMTAGVAARIYGHAGRAADQGRADVRTSRARARGRAPRRTTGRLGVSAKPPTLPTAARTPTGRLRERLSRRVVLRLLRGLRGGELTLLEGHTRHVFGRVDPQRPLRVSVPVHSLGFYPALLRGSIGLAESDMAPLVGLRGSRRPDADRRVGTYACWTGFARHCAVVLVPLQRWARWLRKQHDRARTAPDRRPLRPGQRPVLAVPGPDDDVLLRDLRDAARDPGGCVADQAAPCVREARSRSRRSRAGDRHRLGRLRGVRRRALWLSRHDHDDLQEQHAYAASTASSTSSALPRAAPRPASLSTTATSG